ncbi:MAG: LptF/LptG family permease [Desulfobacterales bacterium]|nr:LptF/LptG family permease [Desulfobacterales bacterium]
MTILDRYLFKQFGRTFLLVLAAVMAIYLLVDFFEQIDNFMEAGHGVRLALRYQLLKMPFIAEQLLPVAILLAGVITLGLLNHHNELLALKAGGISILRITSPIIVVAFIYILIGLAASQWLLPATTSASNRIWYEEVQSQNPRGIFRNGRYYYKGETGFYSFAQPDPNQERFTSFTYTTWNRAYKLTMLLTAEKARWRQGVWSFENGQLKRMNPAGGYDIKLFKTKILDLPETPADLFIPPYKSTEMSISELFQQGESGSRQGNPTAWVGFLARISYIFLGLPLLLSGLPMLILLHQKWGRDLSLAIPASCGLAFAAWVCWGALQSMAKTGYIPPLLAAVAVHLLVSGIGIFFLFRLNR